MLRPVSRIGLILVTLSIALATIHGGDYTPLVAKSSDEAEKAIKRFKLPAGVTAKVWAAEPLLANPVAFAFDERGRCFVAETFRLHHGVTDNRRHMYWLDDDIACRTVDDRVAMYRKHAKDKFESTYEKEHDRVRVVVDSTGSGVADKSFVFADGFKGAAEGIGAGLLARKGSVYYTDIPNLWLLRDTAGENRADVKQPLASGFGVHVAFLGHDLHGLRMGPDGRIYFSMGDRGIHVRTKEGTVLDYPNAGCVLRCEPDGSNLEIVHRGLRNPQELAFDEYGNLFTVDNNSDSGDRARLVQIVEGGDSGWRMSYQYGTATSDRGPFNAEKLWHLPHDGQAAYIVPPLAHITAGPSGLCYHPGVAALPEKYKNHFFVCDFRGGSGGSGVVAFAVKPKGATFELARQEQFVWSLLATDCDFGPDGGFYVSDWVEGWDQTGKGRIYRFTDGDPAKAAALTEVKRLLADGLEKRSDDELAKLLEHDDMRVRQEAQFALAAKGVIAIAPLTAIASRQVKDSAGRMGRIHAFWSLGQVARAGSAEARDVLTRLTADHDSEIRAQGLRMLGDARADMSVMVPYLKDAEPRVRCAAALAIARTLHLNPTASASGSIESARAAILDLLRENEDKDAYLRHSGVTALSELSPHQLTTDAAEPVAVRMGVVLALRRESHANVGKCLSRFLTDPEPKVVLEAARAIHDVPIPDAMPALAALRPNFKDDLALLYRILNANFRLGTPENAARVAAVAAAADAPEGLRVEAVKMLGGWGKPSNRDRIIGDWRPLSPRDPKVAADAVRSKLGAVFAGSDKLRREATAVAAKLGITEVATTLHNIVGDAKQSPAARVEALKGLVALKDARFNELVDAALKSDSPKLRAEALTFVAKRDRADAQRILASALRNGTTPERQAAIVALAELKVIWPPPNMDTVYLAAFEKNGRPEIQLEIKEWLKTQEPDVVSKLEALVDSRQFAPAHLLPWRECMYGGDADRGRDIFLHKTEVSCVRCHKLNGTGGEVGPELAGIGAKQTREYLLESLVLPDKQIAKGFDTVVLELTNGKTVTGVLKSEDAKEIKLITPEGQSVTVAKVQVEERRRGKSAMPEDLHQKVTKRELRDLVEFLSGLK